ncbi:hypothetical protein [Burkholderia cepacia]|uniref:hypothetical protein n=1 Tax=Burkholderia cepacia TaxID=292 RepID=UPI000F5A7185|nr:hypothetical protein [Burkholderia cepacia]
MREAVWHAHAAGCAVPLKQMIRRKHVIARRLRGFCYELKGSVIKGENRQSIKKSGGVPGMAIIKINI